MWGSEPYWGLGYVGEAVIDTNACRVLEDEAKKPIPR